MRGLDPKERALWNWANVDNLDEFLQEVYSYYIGKGIFCIALSRALNLLTIAFVIGFSTFLAGCVNYSKIRDYSKLRHSQKPTESEVDLMLSDVLVDQCVSRFSGLTLLVFMTFIAFYGWQVVRFGLGLSRLVAMNNFYTHLLNIPDAEVQSIPWNEVVSRISHLRETHPTTSLSSSTMRAGSQGNKLDAHDVANRIMRQENYLIALFNKDVLDLTIPLPGLRLRPPALTKTLEWNLTFSLLGFLFDRRGQVRRQFITNRNRGDLIEGLRRRFIFMAAVNAVFAPFIVVYLLLYSFFRYFEEYHKNPASLGSRQYTQFARWKFREFNELPHLFRRRCHESYPFAQRYLDQFPKERTAIVARFVSFIAGSFMAVLLLASVIDWDLVVHLYITPQYNVLFFITVFTAILAVSRGLVPDEQQTFEPEVLLQGVVERTHYLPEHWKGRFHSTEVHADFGSLYQLKISIFVSELLSVIVTPFVLYKSLPKSAPAIIDFFREFTVHVDGLGYVCSFAVFDFARHGNVKFGAPGGYRDGRMASKEGKMEQSLLGFRAANPDWHPADPVASLFLSRVAAAEATSPRHRQGAHASANGKSSGGGGGGGAASSFTPANSTLAQRSQLYNEAFERSISLAKPGNAAALQASAVKIGPRTHAKPKTLQAVDEDEDGLAATTRLSEADEEETGESGYADARFGRSTSLHHTTDGSAAGVAAGDETSLRGLLNHIGGRW
ncbi:APG9-domain-containing protein [Acaromyces ingoldii]|uniref:Autophagy-related protein 9 n=1 Tax=Acaromyces ingoldii TaxID=215250 RepID=A0A316YJ82_9BASI|nr:APG9-domain-containing protein [Acaromyces ingoldii]PWN88153.1 APG9-domain-containing protein [Acaromyces ingoldii]